MQLKALLLTTAENDIYYRRFIAGEETALNYVYHHVQPPLLRLALRIINDRFAAEHLVHEAILKCWQFRQQMESMLHIYCFMRMNLRWKCFAYYKNPVNRFHYGLHYPGNDEDFADIQEGPATDVFNAEKIQLVEEALPYLPPTRRTMVKLYFQYGMSYKTIARRFNASHQGIHTELQQSLGYLKKIIHSKKKLDAPGAAKPCTLQPGTHTGMDAETEQIFKLRYEGKQSFAGIAAVMNLSQAYVQQQYVLAHRKLRQQYA